MGLEEEMKEMRVHLEQKEIDLLRCQGDLSVVENKLVKYIKRVGALEAEVAQLRAEKEEAASVHSADSSDVYISPGRSSKIKQSSSTSSIVDRRRSARDKKRSEEQGKQGYESGLTESKSQGFSLEIDDDEQPSGHKKKGEEGDGTPRSGSKIRPSSSQVGFAMETEEEMDTQSSTEGEGKGERERGTRVKSVKDLKQFFEKKATETKPGEKPSQGKMGKAKFWKKQKE